MEMEAEIPLGFAFEIERLGEILDCQTARQELTLRDLRALNAEAKGLSAKLNEMTNE